MVSVTRPKDRIGKIVGWDCDDNEPAHAADTAHFAFVPKVVYVQFFDKDGNPEAWTHPTLPGTHGVYPVKKKSCIWYVANNKDQRVRRYQIPLTSGLASTIHVAQGREMIPIVELPKRTLPVAAYVALTRTQRSERIIISGDFDFSVFSTGEPLNFRNELLLTKLRGNTQEYDALFARYLQQQSGKTSAAKRQAGEVGCRKRKAAGGENGDPNKKGGSGAQQQAAGQAGSQAHKRKAGQAGGVEQKRKAGVAGSRAGGVEQKRKAGEARGTSRAAESGWRRGYGDEDVLQRGTKAPQARFAHIVNRIACVVGKSVKDALATRVGTADKPESLYSRRLLNQDLDADYIRIEHAASDGSAGKVDDNVRAPIDDLSDEDSSREVDEHEHFPSMALDDLSDRDGYMADPASDVDSPRSADMAIDDMSDGDGPTSPRSSDGVVRPPKVRPNLFDLLQQIESSDDDVSRRVAQAACDSDTSGSDHAVDDEDGSDSEVSMRCKFVDSMAAESRSVQSDEGATSADSDPCETD